MLFYSAWPLAQYSTRYSLLVSDPTSLHRPDDIGELRVTEHGVSIGIFYLTMKLLLHYVVPWLWRQPWASLLQGPLHTMRQWGATRENLFSGVANLSPKCLLWHQWQVVIFGTLGLEPLRGKGGLHNSQRGPVNYFYLLQVCSMPDHHNFFKTVNLKLNSFHIWSTPAFHKLRY